ncbi:hypothetical protein [Nocardia veterana]|uniref:Ig-like domain-containing protein n=1 Tax=Nocardia veterana TaxID=132249 RepID=A0A7X6LU65_9NOCA|nr:hypothetical protein [Nocardia veterana]NKY84134.1 hypothetical protein [Nocardia veterana]
MTVVRKFALCSAVAVSSAIGVMLGSGSGAAETTPFQLNPAPYANPNGSVDSLPAHCVAITGERPGEVTITGADPRGWGCSTAPVRWLNFSTGASGEAHLSNGLNGIPPAATIATGSGQVAVVVFTGGVYTPGFVTVRVP